MIESDTPVPDTAEAAVPFEEPIPPPVDPVAASAALSPLSAPSALPAAPIETDSIWIRAGQEIVAGVKTLASAAIYATLIVTFGFQIARVDGLSMAPTL